MAREREEENEKNRKWSVSLHGGILSAHWRRVKPEAAWGGMRSSVALAARIIHDGSSRNRAVALRDGHAEP